MDLNIISPAQAQANVEAIKNDDARSADIANPDVATEAGKAPQAVSDDFYSKLLKIVPVPIAGAYASGTGFVLAATDVGDQTRDYLLWGLFGFFLIAAIAYLVRREVHSILQLALSAGAFVAIAAATPGPFTEIDGWSTVYGSIVVLAVATVAVVFEPRGATTQQVESSNSPTATA